MHAYEHVARALVTFAQNRIQAPAFLVNTLVRRTAPTTHISTMSRAERVEPVMLAEGIWTHV